MRIGEPLESGLFLVERRRRERERRRGEMEGEEKKEKRTREETKLVDVLK